MKKRIVFLMILALLILLTACGTKDSVTEENDSVYHTTAPSTETLEETEPDTRIHLTVSVKDDLVDRMSELASCFAEEYPDAEYEVSVITENDPNYEADVFLFSMDEFDTLFKENRLHPIYMESEEVKKNCARSAVDVVSVEDELYGYPAWQSDCLLLFYDKTVLSETDLSDFSDILGTLKQAETMIAITDVDLEELVAAYFDGAGIEIDKDLVLFKSEENRKDAIEISSILFGEEYVDLWYRGNQTQITGKIEKEEASAWIGKSIDYEKAKDAFGDSFSYVVLPNVVNGDTVWTSTFATEYWYYGINPNSENLGYAMMFALYLTNVDNQVKNYNEIGVVPVSGQAQFRSDLCEPGDAVIEQMKNSKAQIESIENTECFLKLVDRLIMKEESVPIGEVLDMWLSELQIAENN